MDSKVCVITGGSSGIGLCTAGAMMKAGYVVYELSRRPQGPEGCFHIPTDVTDAAAVTQAVAQVMDRQGRIDVLINNAGYGISGAIEFTAEQDAHHQFDVNFFGMVNMVKAVLPLMRQAKGGRIVNVSSVAGLIPIPFQAYYSASKAAILSYTMALANEARPFGVQVCAILPGDIRTGFTAARRKSTQGDDVYGGRISRSVAGMEHDECNGMAPETAGAYIARIATRRYVKPYNTIGGQYKFFCALAKMLPAKTLNRLVGMIYAK